MTEKQKGIHVQGNQQKMKSKEDKDEEQDDKVDVGECKKLNLRGKGYSARKRKGK